MDEWEFKFFLSFSLIDHTGRAGVRDTISVSRDRVSIGLECELSCVL